MRKVVIHDHVQAKQGEMDDIDEDDISPTFLCDSSNWLQHAGYLGINGAGL